ncbi:replication/maintenance protein RepL [Pasteurella multocida]|uniref:replication/maintenance protein RepL n=1 Tax=Pasteurella multocida TaxID=747 RepID=UPI0035F41F07
MSNIIRYKENPFLENLVIPVRGKQVKISTLGSDDNNIIINQETGEYIGGTHVVTYKKVDEQEFVKVFTQNIALTFDLTSAGIKALSMLFWAVQHTAINKDIVILDQITFDDFITATEKTSTFRTMQRGFIELEKAKIIAKTLRKGAYFINPNFIFNGSRVAFTTLIERKKQQDQSEQLDLVETIETNSN